MEESAGASSNIVIAVLIRPVFMKVRESLDMLNNVLLHLKRIYVDRIGQCSLYDRKY